MGNLAYATDLGNITREIMKIFNKNQLTSPQKKIIADILETIQIITHYAYELHLEPDDQLLEILESLKNNNNSLSDADLQRFMDYIANSASNIYKLLDKNEVCK
jgi:hypothetical protein